jgi:MFS family permease
MVCSGATEQAMGQWASLFAERGLGISKTLGDLFGPCLFAVMMGIVRTLYGMKGQKINIQKILIVCSLLCILSFAITALVPVMVISLLGCSLCGLAVSLLWPGMLSLTASRYPSGGIAMFAMMALGGDLGCAIGPLLTGIVADSSNLNIGLLTGMIFPAIMLIGLFILSNKHNAQSG